ncbi:thiosulfate/3-mercaptopyruvate sulfurtransferase [Paraburkholderia bannensis]|uniref:Thiosulfate/3-mercaptopyruvate sulfurtransferase n=1 Tax=Paraburkholderia bannensis TaxID=765414 RepID=A0A7W9TYZ1_9BURK|nr:MULTISPECIES: rhodanese-like domain-containing protein [Paraburkholderia]MBB3258982.1 thiosulfate/3-mercaptopyruvate sulfurtransferase [Paraburkholderia sp. WP4_3_2]MBB6103996.1 thiosulfate/3-mercaptopyruvate sulfurtransferase [Paraburkholderia bannensis]
MSNQQHDDAARRAHILIEAAELAARLGEPGLVVLDAQVELASPRFDGDYRVASGYDGWLAQRVPGSRHADLTEALAAPHAALSFMRPAPQALAQGLAALGVGPASPVAIYDRSDGFWAARLWWMLRWIGIEARVLDGGWRAWCEAGLPVESGPPHATPAAASFEVHARPGMWADRADIEAIVAGRTRTALVCALSADMFTGKAASRYARRGHIPGSVNLPARNLFDAGGRYASVSALRVAFGALASEQAVCVYCGGGISAAVDALALTLTGHDAVSIYDGSLQEWAADPALPMVTTPTPTPT